MKKFIALVIAVMMVTVMSLAIAAEEAVPSVDTTAPVVEGEIHITDHDNIDEAHPDVDREKFQDIYDELMGADDLSDVIEGIEEGSEVNKVVDVTVTGDKVDELEDGIQVTIDPETDGDFQVVFKGEDGWSIIKDYVTNPDGTITITIYEQGVIAIIVPGEGDVTPPQTSDSMLAVLAVMAVAGAALAVTVAKKRRA